jgi:hypothetical protein
MKVKQLSTFSLYSSLLLSVAHPAYADPPLSRPYPCTEPRIITSYDSNNPNYHYYDHSNIICNNTQGGCNRENVFNTMISQMRFIAPTTSSVPVRHCRETTLPIKNPIKTTINDKSYSIINYTLPGHMLYPGKIVRRVEETSNAIVVRTIGTGMGGYKEFNLKAAPQIWGSADRQLSLEIERKYEPRSSGSLGCQVTVNKVLDAMRSAGAKNSSYSVSKKSANEHYSGNPTNRSDEIIFTLKDSSKSGRQVISNSLMLSPEMQTWANNISLRCANTAIITFGVDMTDFVRSYFVNYSGEATLQRCAEWDRSKVRTPWGQSICQ